MDFLDVLARYVAPAIIGGAAGLFSSWASWGIENRRQKLSNRRELVQLWRSALIPMFSNRKRGWNEIKPELTASIAYSSLRPQLSHEALSMIETDRTPYVGEDRYLTLFINEIGRIEREWHLV